MDVLNVLLALLGISFLIFVHELGHFLVAKRVGIRVETFAIGFQPTIFGWKARLLAVRRGETEYVIGLVPFGGYVKMAGEEHEDPRTGAPDEFHSKSPGQRSLVLVAGATMNLVFGFLIFIVAFAIGVDFESNRLGWVVPGEAAWEAGLRPGDRILAIDGKPKRHFSDLATTIALGGPEPIEVAYERPSPVPGDAPTTATAIVTPRKDRSRGLHWIAVEPSVTPRISTVVPGSPAESGGIAAGEEIASVTIIPSSGDPYAFPSSWPMRVVLAALSDGVGADAEAAVEFGVRGDPASGIRTVRLEPKWEAGGEKLLGAHLAHSHVMAVRPGSEPFGRFPVKVEVRSIAGRPIATFDAGTILSLAPRAGEIELGFEDGRTARFDRDRLLDWLMTGDLDVAPPLPRVLAVDSGSAAEIIGLLPGDQLLRIRDTPLAGQGAPAGELEPGTEVVWLRAGEEMSAQIPAAGPLGAKLAPSARVGRVVPGGPAESAGLLPGDTLLRVGDRPIESWADLRPALSAALGSAKGGTVPVVVARGGEEIAIEIRPAPLRAASFGLVFEPERITLKSASPLDAIATGASQTKLWGQRIFLMLGALARREVSPKNLAGPVGIVHIGQVVARESFAKLLFFLAMISVNLGIFNLLPFPILDGGHLFFILIEKIKGSPVDERIQGWANMVAFVLLIGLALFVTYHDILRIFG